MSRCNPKRRHLLTALALTLYVHGPLPARDLAELVGIATRRTYDALRDNPALFRREGRYSTARWHLVRKTV